MIQAVVFDVGGVLLRTQDQTSRQKWEKKLGLQIGELEYLFFNSPEGQKAQLGITDEEAHWLWLGEYLHLSTADLATLRHDFWEGDNLNHDLVAYIRSLRPRYQTAIISNAMTGLREVLHTDYPIADAFDLIVVSAEEGVMKPDAGIYHRTLTRLGREPHEAVFVDDFAHNIAGAEAVGMAGVHFRGDVSVPAEFAKLGIQ